MKRLMVLVVLVLGYGTVRAAQDNQAPYLYYYSSALNAFVVERADGSDSRTLGEGLTSSDSNYIGGPGWSPDGQWFAWNALKRSDNGVDDNAKARVIRGDNLARLKTLDFFVGPARMVWSADSHYLFVEGKTGFNSPFRPNTFWIIDITQDSLIADMDMFTYSVEAPIEWQLDQQKLTFYTYEEYPVNPNTMRVTMFLDGRVIKEPITQAEYDAAAARLLPNPDDYPYNAPLSSPSGHYVNDKLDVLTDAVTKLNFNLPPHSDAAGPIPIAVRWHPAEDWVLFGYQACFTDCSLVGGVNVVNVVTGAHREISECGFSTTCVNWLPENVDISRLPKAQTTSVLPAPIRYNYDVDYATGVEFSKNSPLITCDPATDKHFHILNPKTRETIFILRTRPDCTGTEKWEPYPFAFALSPNGKWYALTDGIYDAQSDELLARFNTYGWELAFSADSSQLSMRSVNARLVWDVQELLDSGKEMKLLANYFQR